MVFFTQIEKPKLKFIWDIKGPQIAKIDLENNKAVVLITPGFKTY